MISDILLTVVDVQGKLAESMHEAPALHANIARLVTAFRTLDLPLLWLEQVPDKLGPTLPVVRDAIGPGTAPIRKTAFSCFGEPVYRNALDKSKRNLVVLCGIETHVCVFQTAQDLVTHGYAVHVPADCVSSRAAENKAIALRRMEQLGATITSTEMLLFELLETADHPKFRDIARMVR